MYLTWIKRPVDGPLKDYELPCVVLYPSLEAAKPARDRLVAQSNSGAVLTDCTGQRYIIPQGSVRLTEQRPRI